MAKENIYSGEKQITIGKEKYKVRTQLIVENGKTSPDRYFVQYLPGPKPLDPIPVWTNLGERNGDSSNNWTFTNAAGSGFREALANNGPTSLTNSLDEATINALEKKYPNTKSREQLKEYITKGNGQEAIVADKNQGINENRPVVKPKPIEPIALPEIKSNLARTSYGPYYYPLDLDKNENSQDIIKFTMKKSPKIKFDPNFGKKTITKTNTEELLGSVFLPVQPMITDSNQVNWSGLTLNSLEAYAAGAAINLMNSEDANNLIERAGKMMGQAFEQFKLNRDSYGTGINVALAQEALGLQGLLSRTTGAVLNPNLELLFQGPQLRPFTFSFRMSPRSVREAKNVRSIIRFFKQGMAVQTTKDNIFLKSPHIFDIKYLLDGSDVDHPSINKIKTCALINCSVNYTPDGSYMTFNDSLRTMTSYEITLQFSEIEPVYESDYKGIADDEIGY